MPRVADSVTFRFCSSGKVKSGAISPTCTGEVRGLKTFSLDLEIRAQDPVRIRIASISASLSCMMFAQFYLIDLVRPRLRENFKQKWDSGRTYLKSVGSLNLLNSDFVHHLE